MTDVSAASIGTKPLSPRRAEQNGLGGFASARWPKTRVIFLGAIVTYIATFWITYVQCVVPKWEYYGFGYNSTWTSADVIFIASLAMLPALWLPVRVSRPSHFFILVQYLIVYVPALIFAYHSVLPELTPSERIALCLMLLCGMTILQAAQRFWPLLRVPRLPAKPGIYYGVLAVCLIAGILYLVKLLGANFRLVGITDVYDVREDATNLLEASGSSLGGYVFSWLDGVVLPLLLAIALHRRRLWVGLVAVGAYAFLYGVWASKISVVAPFYLFGLYVLMSRRDEQVPIVFLLCCTGFIGLPLLIVGDDPFVTLFRTVWVAVVNVRSFSVPGLLVVQYLQFFSDHPLTLGSHISGLNAFISYPYDYDVPRTVGYYYYGNLMTANVNYWAQDGLAGFGLLGIPVISLLAAATSWLLDSVTRPLPMRFVLVALGPVLLTISNASLFTTLLTGGLVFFFAAFIFAPAELAPSVRAHPSMRRA